MSARPAETAPTRGRGRARGRPSARAADIPDGGVVAQAIAKERLQPLPLGRRGDQTLGVRMRSTSRATAAPTGWCEYVKPWTNPPP